MHQFHFQIFSESDIEATLKLKLKKHHKTIKTNSLSENRLEFIDQSFRWDWTANVTKESFRRTK